MTEDSVMMSLRELHALEEKRLVEEEDRRVALARAREAEERERMRAKHEAEERRQAEERARKTAEALAEHDRRVRDEAIREAELLKARLAADAEHRRVAADEEARRAVARDAAELAQLAQQRAANDRTRARRLWILSTALALSTVGTSTVAALAAQRANRTEQARSVLECALSDERAETQRLRGAADDKDKKLDQLQRRVDTLLAATNVPSGGALVDGAVQPPSRPSAGKLGASSGPSSAAAAGRDGAGKAASAPCDRFDPLCGFAAEAGKKASK